MGDIYSPGMAAALKDRLDQGRKASGFKVFLLYFGIVSLAIGLGAAVYVLLSILNQFPRTILMVLFFVPVGVLCVWLSTSGPGERVRAPAAAEPERSGGAGGADEPGEGR